MVRASSGQVELARSSGTLSWLPFALTQLALFRIQEGALAEAEALIVENESIDPGVMESTMRYAAVLLAVWRGDAPRASELMEQMIVAVSNRGEGFALTYVDYMKAVLYNGLADYERAAEVAHSAASTNDVPMSAWALPELVKAAVRSGQLDRASAACERLSAMTAASGTAWARGTAALAQALIADDGVAERLYHAAIELLGNTPMKAYLARARLCYGEWLRRTDRGGEGSPSCGNVRCVYGHGRQRICRAFPTRARGGRAKAAYPPRGPGREIDTARTSDRSACADAAHQSRDRRRTVPERTHR